MLVPQTWRKEQQKWLPVFSNEFNIHFWKFWKSEFKQTRQLYQQCFKDEKLMQYLQCNNVTIESTSNAEHKSKTRDETKMPQSGDATQDVKTATNAFCSKNNKSKTSTLPTRPAASNNKSSHKTQHKNTTKRTTQKRIQTKAKTKVKSTKTTSKCKSTNQKHRFNGKTSYPISKPPTLGSLTTKPILVLAPKRFKQLKEYLKSKCECQDDISFEEVRKMSHKCLDTMRHDQPTWRMFWDPDYRTIANREHFKNKCCLLPDCQQKHSHFHCGICQFHVPVGTRMKEFDAIRNHVGCAHTDPHIKRISRKIKLFKAKSKDCNYDFEKLRLGTVHQDLNCYYIKCYIYIVVLT